MTEVFGTTSAGETIHRLTLKAGELSARFLTLGAILQDMRIEGVAHGLTLGSEDAADYAGPLLYAGAIVGPVANRIAGATATLNGRRCRFEANEGPNTLHGGFLGTHGRIWSVEAAESDRLVLVLGLADGAGGFPGNRRISAEFALDPRGLTLKLSAASDGPTFVNLANHSYWHVGGPGVPQILRVEAAHYLPVDDALIPTGDIAPVEGTRFDFREGRAIGGQGYDHNLCLSTGRRGPSPAAELSANGLRLRIETTEPGFQVYDGNPLAVALEPQGWPDAPNRPAFPSVRLEPGETWRQITRWSVSRD
jgi:aldose 1-epimerase